MNIWIIVDDGNVFEGTLEQFQECFFTNSDPETVITWATEHGWKATWSASN